MKHLKIALIIITIFCFSATVVPVFASVSPKDQLRETIDKILIVLKDPQYKGDAAKEERRKVLRVIIKERFDFLAMTVSSLGSHKKKFNKDQINQIADINGQILEAFYIDRIEAYTDEEVQFKKVKVYPGGKKAAVQTEIITESEPIPISYSLKLDTEGSWKVNNIKVVDINWNRVKRDEWGPTLRKSSFEEFVVKLEEILEKMKK